MLLITTLTAVSEAASAEPVDGGAFLSCFCFDSFKSRWRITCCWWDKWKHPWRGTVVVADTAVVAAIVATVVTGCCCCSRLWCACRHSRYRTRTTLVVVAVLVDEDEVRIRLTLFGWWCRRRLLHEFVGLGQFRRARLRRRFAHDRAARYTLYRPSRRHYWTRTIATDRFYDLIAGK